MSRTLEKAGICSHCGAPLRPEGRHDGIAPPEPEYARYDLAALAAEAAEDKAYDQVARVRVTQQDIRKLLERRRKDRK